MLELNHFEISEKELTDRIGQLADLFKYDLILSPFVNIRLYLKNSIRFSQHAFQHISTKIFCPYLSLNMNKTYNFCVSVF